MPARANDDRSGKPMAGRGLYDALAATTPCGSREPLRGDNRRLRRGGVGAEQDDVGKREVARVGQRQQRSAPVHGRKTPGRAA